MNLRLLGFVAMLCAPAILIIGILNGFQRTENPQVDPYLYLIFAVGWFCGMVGLRQLHATGNSIFGRVVAILPLVTLPLAMMQSVFDLTSFDTSSPLYMVSDVAWPLSMLLTLIVGVTALFAGTLKGWRRFVPFFCGLGLPMAILLSLVFGDQGTQLSFPIHTALGWFLIGLVVFAAKPTTVRTAAFG